MAILIPKLSNTNKTFPSLKLLNINNILLYLSTTITIFTSFSNTNALSFNFTSFTKDHGNNITYEGSAFLSNNQAIIELAGTNQAMMTMGRVTYSKPLRLWDKASGELADFSTHFSFVIDSGNKTSRGDGLAFFLQPAGSKLNPNITKGGSMGLIANEQRLNATKDPFVAVEFDVCKNHYDPPGDHVGIDVNSMQSKRNLTWFSDVPGGKRNYAFVRYDSAAKELSVYFTGFSGNATFWQSLSYQVDLRTILPENVSLGFSAATGVLSAAHAIYSWDFTSTEVGESPNSSNDSAQKRKKEKNIVGIAGGSSAGGIFLLGLVLFGLWKRMIKRQGNKEDQREFDKYYLDGEFEKGVGPRKYSYRKLARSTNNFSDKEKLGQGGFGGVYKGFLADIEKHVAVKRIEKGSRHGVKEYATEVKVISRLRHRNLVQLIGWCHERKELLLVYELLPNGSLDSHLFGGDQVLPWEARHRIAQGLASALLYLHEEWEECVVHRDIKSSNIMLDSSFNAKLGDFGLARLMDHEKGAYTTALAGTRGYMAPECVATRKASRESDMYSFGVVALEIACGRKPVDPSAPLGRVVMVEWVWEMYGGGDLLGAADPRLGGNFDVAEMERLMVVGLWCAHPDNKLRPSIRQAIQVLYFGAPMPILPLEMPSYLTPSFNTPESSLIS